MLHLSVMHEPFVFVLAIIYSTVILALLCPEFLLQVARHFQSLVCLSFLSRVYIAFCQVPSLTFKRDPYLLSPSRK